MAHYDIDHDCVLCDGYMGTTWGNEKWTGGILCDVCKANGKTDEDVRKKQHENYLKYIEDTVEEFQPYIDEANAKDGLIKIKFFGDSVYSYVTGSELEAILRDDPKRGWIWRIDKWTSVISKQERIDELGEQAQNLRDRASAVDKQLTALMGN